MPNRPGQAFILQGSRNYSPGIFPQLVVPVNETARREVFIFNTGERIGNFTDWKHVRVPGVFPEGREGASVALDSDGNAVYLIGGRVLDE